MKLLIPLLLTVRTVFGMAPMELRLSIKADENQREVCVVVDGPEYHKDCFTPRGRTQDMKFQLHTQGSYEVFAVSDTYRTRSVVVEVQ